MTYPLPLLCSATHPKRKRGKRWCQQLSTHIGLTSYKVKPRANLLLYISTLSYVRPHPIYDNINSILDSNKAAVHAKLLTGRYPLTTSNTAGTLQCASCPLCQQGPETTAHFVLHCDALASARRCYMRHILDTCCTHSLSIDPDDLIQIVLDPATLPAPDKLHVINTRNLLFKLHSTRSVTLGGDSGYKLATRNHNSNSGVRCRTKLDTNKGLKRRGR